MTRASTGGSAPAQTSPVAARGKAMPRTSKQILTTPRRDDLGLTRIANGGGLLISLLPSGAIFAMEHADGNRRIMINQTLASPIASGMARLYLRLGGTAPAILPVIGPERGLAVG